MKYAVEINTILDGWVNTWTNNDQSPVVFDTFEQAQVELEEYLLDVQAAFENGDIDTPYPREDYRIIEVTE